MRSLIFLLMTIFFLSSCDENRVFEKNNPFDSSEWNSADTLEYSIKIEDEIPKNIYLNLRHTFYFEWRNAWMKLWIISPNGTTTKTPVNIILSKPETEWLSDCSGDVCNMQFIIPEYTNYTFEDTGIYQFKLVHDMRQNPLQNILSAGLRIENVEEQ